MMSQKINRYFSVNLKPVIKKNILQIIDLYYKIMPGIVGNIIRYPALLRHMYHSKVIAKPGILSFKGGAFNPGALILEDNKILLLAKSQILPWFKAIGKKRKYYLQGNPISLILDKTSLKTETSSIITDFIGYPSEHEYAIEDLRLFAWREKKMINHSFIKKYSSNDYLQIKSVSSALSILENDDKTLRFLGFPKLDFPTNEFEKNWVYTENGEQLLLFYSINPYIVLALQDEKEFTFKTVIKKQLNSKISDPEGFGAMVSFSTNPVDFDKKHWMVIIHQFKKKITGRWYIHWAVLIDKTSLLPVKITSKPIFTGAGARGRVPGYRYISSILKINEDILFFAGEGDVYITVTKKKIDDLLSLFVNV